MHPRPRRRLIQTGLDSQNRGFRPGRRDPKHFFCREVSGAEIAVAISFDLGLLGPRHRNDLSTDSDVVAVTIH